MAIPRDLSVTQADRVVHGCDGTALRLCSLVMAAFASLSAIPASMASDVTAQDRVSTNIPAQRLGPALQALCRDRHIHLVYVEEDIRDRHSQGATGNLLLDEALQQLLRGTGLTYRYLDDATVSILPMAPVTDTPSSPGGDLESTTDTPRSRATTGVALSTGAGARDPYAVARAKDRSLRRARKMRSVADGAALEEIIVTAQKREQNLQDVGISITALTAARIRQLNVLDSTGIAQQIPGLQLNAWSPKLTTFNLRGVSQNNFEDHLEAPIAVYTDEVYVGSMNAISGPLFDMERIEVLRGPQGTLFGRNATGGVIHYVSRTAADDALNGYIEVSAAEFDEYASEGAIGGRIFDGMRGRVAFRREISDGYIDGTLPGIRAVGGSDTTALRGTIQADLGESALADLILTYSDDDDVPTGNYVAYTMGRADPVTGLGLLDGTVVRPFEHDSDFQGFMDRKKTGVTGKFTWQSPRGIEVKSITNVTYMDLLYAEDADASPALVVNFTTDVDYRQWSQELRISGDSAAGRWQAGAYYLDMDYVGNNTFAGLIAANEGVKRGIIAAPPGGLTPDNFPSGAATVSHKTLASTNWSLFAQADFDFTERLTGVLGLRWSQDDKEFTSRASYRDDATPLTQYFDVAADIAATSDPALKDANRIDYGDYAVRAGLDIRATDDVLLYASYNRGIKSGNFSTGIGVSLANLRHDEEVLKAYEVGLKADFLDTVRLNASIYYYDYDGYQAYALSNQTPQITNTDATAMGGELEAFISPNEHWQLAFGMSYETSEVAEILPINAGAILRNNELPNAPRFSVNALIRYQWTVGAGEMALQLDGVAYDDQYLEVTNSEVSHERGFAIWNASFAYTSPDDTWSLAAWVKNAGDRAYRLYEFDFGALGSTAFYAPPRWAGVTARFNF